MIMPDITHQNFRVTTMLLVTLACLVSGCTGESVRIDKPQSVDMQFEQDPQMLAPLNVPVAAADDDWWFYDNLTFVGRVHGIGNIILVAEIGRCLDPGSRARVTKTFRCKFYDGKKWVEITSYSEPDVITEMKTISINPQMELSWRKPQESGTLKCLALSGGWISVDFIELKPYYSFGDGVNLKRSYASGLGRLNIRDSVVQGQMFYEMINTRGNNRCNDDIPGFRPENYSRIFAQTAAGKTIIASVDIGNPDDQTHNCFFTICDVEVCKMAQGCALVSSANKIFARSDRFDGYIPQFVSIYSGDSINVQIDLWIEKDKDEWDKLGDGWMRSGGYGNAVFWNRREKAWGLIDRFQSEESDTLKIMGAIRKTSESQRPKNP